MRITYNFVDDKVQKIRIKMLFGAHLGHQKTHLGRVLESVLGDLILYKIRSIFGTQFILE